MFDEMVPELLRFYEQTERQLNSAVAAATTAFERRRAELLLEQIDSIIRALEERQRGWCRKHLPRAYRKGVSLTAEAYQMPVLPRMTLLDRRSIDAVIARVMADTADGVQSIAPFARRLWIDTQQRLVREARLARLIAEGRVIGLGPQELGRRIKQTLQDAASERLRGYVPDRLREDMERAARGEYITIKGRHYKLGPYGELVARTATRFAATEGVHAAVVEAGGDLVQISVHNTACPMCIPVQGRVYSLTGRTKGFPLYTDAVRVPLHPRCHHQERGVSAEILGIQDELSRLRGMSAREKPFETVDEWRTAFGRPATSLGPA